MRNLIVLLAVTFALAACKKELKIEKNLWKKDGVWNIDQMHATQSSTNTIDNFDEVISNYGTITFKKDGSGVQRITVDGDVEFHNFTYANTTNVLTLTINGKIRNFDMDWKKDKMTLSIAESFSADGEFITYTEVMKLTKE